MDTNTSQSRIIRLPEVKHRTGLSRSSIYAGIKAGTFPHHIRLGARAVGWTLDSVTAWIATRTAQGRPQ
ncbi:MAG: AlpA family transcriptional regulator [Proteobacteria bacterium]|nr:AlpA family transcriptional regulator [Pseudomonadota bacterium]